MTAREWKVEALRHIMFIRKHPDNRHDNEYADYLKRFYFGGGEVTFDGNNDTWKEKKKSLCLPMPRNVYLMM